MPTPTTPGRISSWAWRVERNPGAAADAFYWASRLDPSSPQTLYALAIARLPRDPALLVRYRERDRRTLASPAARTLDSLRFRAEMQDPFFHRGMDQIMLYAYARNAVRREEWFGRSEDFGRTGMVQFIERFFSRRPTRTVGANCTTATTS